MADNIKDFAKTDIEMNGKSENLAGNSGVKLLHVLVSDLFEVTPELEYAGGLAVSEYHSDNETAYELGTRIYKTMLAVKIGADPSKFYLE
jgi:hypothetical protein